jgi:hypothetical protein
VGEEGPETLMEGRGSKPMIELKNGGKTIANINLRNHLEGL